MELISEKQLVANRQNSLKGGVKTEGGKEVVRFNARKHGILSSLVANYEDNLFQGYLDNLFEEFKPTSFIENILVERIALYYLKLYRLSKAEGEFMQSCIEPTTDTFSFSFGKEEGYVPVVNAEHIKHLLEIYARYETTIENRLYRAIRELKDSRLQAS
jgi:hypothetical protein